MSARRFDLFGPSHKALRRAFYTLSMKAAATDFTDEVDLEVISDLLWRAVEFARLWIRVVDRFIHPAIEARVPGTTARYAEQYATAAEELNAIEGLFSKIEQAGRDRAKVRGLGIVLGRAVDQFIADHHDHWRHEEEVFAPLLWAAYTDEELAAVQSRIIESFRGEDLQIAFSLMLPAMSFADRVGLLLALQAAAPLERFEEVRAMAEQVLSPEGWRELAAAL